MFSLAKQIVVVFLVFGANILKIMVPILFVHEASDVCLKLQSMHVLFHPR
jgi:hypothetical protein